MLNQMILFSEVWDEVEDRAETKIQEGQITNDIPMFTHYKQISPILNLTPLYSVSLANNNNNNNYYYY